ncbi:hypothetical protein [Ruegeria atlantica]|uniref:hypothetical protein n=1 Tax=Ruegeria atlantica TaxID=81569 RepID=UPI0014812AAD|nr:hypothetical protein [Ruegeria atlantica]
MARQPDRVKQMIPVYVSVLVSAPGIAGGFDGGRVLRACDFVCSAAAADFDCAAEDALVAEAAGRARDFSGGVAAAVEDAAGAVFRATGLAFLATVAAGFAWVFGCDAGLGAGFAFAAGSARGVTAARGFAENSAGLGSTTATFFTVFFTAAVFLTAGFGTRGAVAFTLTGAFSTGFSGDAAATCNACTGAIGNSNAERVTICMIFIWLTIA